MQPCLVKLTGLVMPLDFICRDNQFFPRHAELGALLLDNERSGFPLTDMI